MHLPQYVTACGVSAAPNNCYKSLAMSACLGYVIDSTYIYYKIAQVLDDVGHNHIAHLGGK